MGKVGSQLVQVCGHGLTESDRTYYGRPTSSTALSRPESHRFSTSTDNISLNAFRTHSGPNNGKPRELRRSKIRIGSKPDELDLTVLQDASKKRFSPTWSPHLWHHRTSIVKRRTIFIAPSLDEREEGLTLTKRNAQVACFVLGFLFPPGKPPCVLRLSYANSLLSLAGRFGSSATKETSITKH